MCLDTELWIEICAWILSCGVSYVPGYCIIKTVLEL